MQLTSSYHSLSFYLFGPSSLVLLGPLVDVAYNPLGRAKTRS